MSASGFQVRGWHVLTAMLTFFATVIAVNVTFAVFAVQSFPGEDVRRSYLQGLHYNATLAERRTQAQLGWQAAAALRRDGDGALLDIVLSAADNAPIEGATLSGELQRPTSSQFDRELTFQSLGGGRYVARLGDLHAGAWRLRARAERGAGALDFESELAWRP